MSATSVTMTKIFDGNYYENLDPARKEQVKPAVEAITKAANTLTDSSRSRNTYSAHIKTLACALIDHLEERGIPSSRVLDSQAMFQIEKSKGRCLIGYETNFNYLINYPTAEQGQVDPNNNKNIIRGIINGENGDIKIGCFKYEKEAQKKSFWKSILKTS